ncbi:hypothetical protein DE146DRAFT_34175 [Phaeosphaeria sp. MPI-PUGE-AT-0046c]|nr:hypothetical protein DE146DRAFT_34175 [Phaeosphaeria sp. MPI-PUGE-AT-0046c]
MLIPRRATKAPPCYQLSMSRWPRFESRVFQQRATGSDRPFPLLVSACKCPQERDEGHAARCRPVTFVSSASAADLDLVVTAAPAAHIAAYLSLPLIFVREELHAAPSTDKPHRRWFLASQLHRTESLPERSHHKPPPLIAASPKRIGSPCARLLTRP